MGGGKNKHGWLFDRELGEPQGAPIGRRCAAWDIIKFK